MILYLASRRTHFIMMFLILNEFQWSLARTYLGTYSIFQINGKANPIFIKPSYPHRTHVPSYLITRLTCNGRQFRRKIELNDLFRNNINLIPPFPPPPPIPLDRQHCLYLHTLHVVELVVHSNNTSFASCKSPSIFCLGTTSSLAELPTTDELPTRIPSGNLPTDGELSIFQLSMHSTFDLQKFTK